MWLIAALDARPDRRDAGSQQQLAQLGEPLLAPIGERGDHVGALTRTGLSRGCHWYGH